MPLRYVAMLEVDNDVLIRGDLCITDPKSLYEALVDDDCTEIEITNEFAKKYFTYGALTDFVLNCTKIAPDKRVIVDDTYYSNAQELVSKIKSYRSTSELIFAMESNPSKFMSCIRMLCDYYLEAQDDALLASNRVASMLTHIKELEDEVTAKNKEIDSLHELNNNTSAALKTIVSRLNFKYEKTIDPDKLFVATQNSYKHILYIKEITRIHYTDSLLYYVQEMMKTLYNMPVRFVVIEPHYAYSRASMYPGCQPHWKLRYSDVYSGNIFMAGYAPKVMEDVLQNSSHVPYLIVLDRGGYITPHIQGGNVSYVYTASDLNDVPDDIQPESVISYSDETLHIPYIDNFESLSLEDKIRHYSTFDITKRLINTLEEA